MGTSSRRDPSKLGSEENFYKELHCSQTRKDDRSQTGMREWHSWQCEKMLQGLMACEDTRVLVGFQRDSEQLKPRVWSQTCGEMLNDVVGQGSRNLINDVLISYFKEF